MIARFKPSMSWGLTSSASVSSWAAPANSLRTRTPRSATRARHELLGDQVHAVVERRHEHHVGGAIERGDLDVLEGLMDVVNRRRPDSGEIAVDLADELLDASAFVSIRGHPVAARARNLDKH